MSNYNALEPSELKNMLEQRGINYSDCLEGDDLARRLEHADSDFGASMEESHSALSLITGLLEDMHPGFEHDLDSPTSAPTSPGSLLTSLQAGLGNLSTSGLGGITPAPGGGGLVGLPPSANMIAGLQVLPTNGVRWAAGFVRIWIQPLTITPSGGLIATGNSSSTTTTTSTTSSSSSSSNSSGSSGTSNRTKEELDTDHLLEPELESYEEDLGKVSPTNASSTKKTVRAIFYRSFLDSIMASHDRVGSFLESGVITSQVSKYGRHTKRVSNSMHKYYTHYFLCPRKSFREALQSLFPVSVTSPDFKNQLVMITEEIPPMTEFHTFEARTVSLEEAVRLQAEGTLILTGDYWRFMGNEHTYYDYFLAYDEQKYTTFLDFVARLHIITSPNHIAVAPDNRMFVADSLALIYSAYDSVADVPALDRRVGLIEFLNNRLDLVKMIDLEPVTVTWQGRSVNTFLATPSALRRTLLALEQQCLERAMQGNNEETKIIESNWSVRIRNFLTYQFPVICQTAFSVVFPTDVFNNSKPPLDSFVDVQVVPKTKWRATPKRITVGAEKINTDGLQKEEHVVCAMTFSLCSNHCGCQRFQFESLSIEFPLRVSLLSVARVLQHSIEDLFQGDLPLIQLGRDGISRASLSMFKTATKILYSLQQLGLVAPENFDQDNQAIVNMGKIEFPVMPLIPIMRSRAPLTRLHHYLKNNERRMEKVAVEVVAGRLAALSIACCVTAILHEAEKREGLRESVLTFNVFGESLLGVAEASMIVNVVLKSLDTASFQLLSAVLGTAEENFVDSRISPELVTAANAHPMILASHPNAIENVTCGCVVCVAVATTRSGTWNRSHLRPKLLRSEARLAIGNWENGIVKLLCKMVLPHKAFIAQRSFSYILHNAPDANSPLEPDWAPRQASASALDIDETRDEWLTAVWDSKNDAAASRVRSAMIIGAQATGGLPATFAATGEEKMSGSTICRARFIWPGWLCSLISKEAQGLVPKGSAHLAATQAVTLTPISELSLNPPQETGQPTPQGSPRESTVDKFAAPMRAKETAGVLYTGPSKRDHLISLPPTDSDDIIYLHTSANSSPVISQLQPPPPAPIPQVVVPSTGPRNKKQVLQGKSNICQPHPVYSWALDRMPLEDEIVLIDLVEKKRVCFTLNQIAELKSRPVFISHIWETPWHPDPCGRQMGTAVQKCESHRYLWVDYVSLPQGEKNDAEKLRFRKTLMNLQALQSRMITIAPDDEHDKSEWQRRGWCIVEAIVGDLASPLAQAVVTEFRQHRTLVHVFDRLRIRVTNPSDIPILDEILGRHLPVMAQQKTTIPRYPISLLAVVPITIPPAHYELDAARRARERHR